MNGAPGRHRACSCTDVRNVIEACRYRTSQYDTAPMTAEAANQNVQSEGVMPLKLFKTIHARLKSQSMPPLSVEPPMLASKRHLSRGTLTALTGLTATRILVFSFSFFLL